MAVAPSIFYTEPSRWFMEQLLALQPGTQNGGLYANKPGYHNTRNQNLPTNYSVILGPDKLGPATKSAAYDWTFPDAQAGRYELIDRYSSRLLAAGQARDPRVRGWREFYGQADADTAVEGWDFWHNGPRTSDSSHLWHIHLSELRQYVDDMTNKRAMLSVLRGETLEQWLNGGDDMFTYNDHQVLEAIINMSPTVVLDTDATVDGSGALVKFPNPLAVFLNKLAADVAEIKAGVGAGGTGDGATPDEVRTIVDEELDEAFRGAADANG